MHHIGHSREKEIFDTVTTMRHGLVSQKYILPWDEHFTINSKSKQSLKSTKTNEISNIFLPYENIDGSTTIPKCILIEGAAGMGKTTLCKEIAYRWAKQGLLEDTKLVFLVYLRDPDVIKIKNLNDLVHYLYNFDESAAELSKQCAQVLITRDNSDVMIILDGYDEFNSSEYSVITDIMVRKVLPQSRIVVTSRLTASDKLRRMADVRVEVLGFTDESKAEYIKEELKGFPDKIEELQFYLSSHAAINSICYMPIMMTILVYIFKEKEELPTESTELYQKFLALTISHHLQKQNKTEDLFVSLQNLPTVHKKYLVDLSKFAFLTLKSNKKVFSNEDIITLCPNSILSNTSLESFGLVVSVQYFSTDKGNSHVFNFLHLSIHEYLSAYHISSVDQCKQFNELESTFLNEQYKETWSTFVAINKRHCLTFQNYLIYCKDKHHEELSSCIANYNNLSVIQRFIEFSIKIINSNTITSSHIQLLFKKSACVYHWQFYLSFCSTKIDFPKMLEMFLLDDDLLSEWDKFCDEVVQYKSLACLYISWIKILFGFKVDQQQLIKSFKLNISFYKITLRDCYIANSTIDAIMSHLSNIRDLKGVMLNNCIFEQGGFTRLSALLNNIATSWCLSIFNSTFTKEDMDGLISIILNNNNLQRLYLWNNNFEGDITKAVKSSLHNFQHVSQDFQLGDVQIIDKASTSEVVSSKNSLGQSSTFQEASYKSAHNLEKLWMYNNNLKSSAIALLQSLSTISTLKLLNLNDNQIPEEAGEALASVILHNTGLEELHLSGNNLGEGLLYVAKALQHISSLRSLDLGNNNISKEVSDEIALAITANKYLEEMRLYNINLKSSAIVILQSLSIISTLKLLNLNDNQITEEAGEPLASVILCNPGIEELHLRNNNIAGGLIIVAKALQHVTLLKSIDVSNNNIPKEVSNELTLVIESNKHLEKILLHNNNLKSSAITILQSLNTISILKLLDLSNNQITKEAGEALASVILHNTGLEELYLSDNNLGEGLSNIMKALQHVTSLRVLGLGDNNITKEVSGDLAHVIKSNMHLQKLWLYNNNLKSSAIPVLQSLSTISTLKILNINNNQITEEAGEALASVILHNTGLEELCLYGNDFGKSILQFAKAL